MVLDEGYKIQWIHCAHFLVKLIRSISGLRKSSGCQIFKFDQDKVLTIRIIFDRGDYLSFPIHRESICIV